MACWAGSLVRRAPIAPSLMIPICGGGSLRPVAHDIGPYEHSHSMPVLPSISARTQPTLRLATRMLGLGRNLRLALVAPNRQWIMITR